jgi:Ni/Co efflux regulator RcnB
MKTINRIMTGILTVSMLMSSMAFAHGGPSHHVPQAKPNHGNFDRGPDVRQQQFNRGNEHRKGPPPHARGAGPKHNFYRGGKLPPQYRHHQYVVDDWRGHGLSAPPRGQRWVQVGSDYVLAAIATGIIMRVLLGN